MINAVIVIVSITAIIQIFVIRCDLAFRHRVHALELIFESGAYSPLSIRYLNLYKYELQAFMLHKWSFKSFYPDLEEKILRLKESKCMS